MKILYFAWLRERLNKNEEDVVLPADVETVGDLIAWLAARDETAELAFANPRIIRAALDTDIVDHATPLGSARTVALFPPMTGG